MTKYGKESLTTGQKFKKTFAKVSIKAVKGLQKIIKGTTRTLKFMGIAAKVTGKAIRFMSKATGILALIGGIATLFDNLMKRPMDLVTNVAKMLKLCFKVYKDF